MMRGDDAEYVFENYARKVAFLARQHLSGQLARRVDPEDIAQSVFRSFFRRQELGEFHIETSAELWRLLVKITLAKVRSRARRETAAKRDVSSEFSGDDWLTEAQSRQPGPEDAAMFLDLVETLVEGLPETHCQILSLRLEGCTKVEIAENLQLSRQTVHRVLKLFQERLERLDR